MSKRWWTIVTMVVGAKIYLLGSWLWRGSDDAYAEPPQATISSARPGEGGDTPAPPRAHRKVSPHAEVPPNRSAGKTVSSELALATPRACLAALRSVSEERAHSDRRNALLLARERALLVREAAARKIFSEGLALSQRAEGALARALEERKQGRTDRTLRVARLLGAMKPLEAAPVVARLLTPHAVAALGEMEVARASKILGALSPEAAALISEGLLARPSASAVVKGGVPPSVEPGLVSGAKTGF